jgi:hypothetical protein
MWKYNSVPYVYKKRDTIILFRVVCISEGVLRCLTMDNQR